MLLRTDRDTVYSYPYYQTNAGSLPVCLSARQHGGSAIQSVSVPPYPPCVGRPGATTGRSPGPIPRGAVTAQFRGSSDSHEASLAADSTRLNCTILAADRLAKSTPENTVGSF